MTKNNISTALLALLLASVVFPAAAQNTSFLRKSPVAGMDAKDQAILRAALDEVLAAPDGTTKDWKNPETGSFGRIQVLDSHKDMGTTCRNVRMSSEASGRKGAGNYRLCLADDNTWRFAPNQSSTAAKPVTEPGSESSQ
jgi:surface antigen